MKFKNLWKKMAEIDEIKFSIKILGLMVIDIDTDWSRKWFSITILNFKWHL